MVLDGSLKWDAEARIAFCNRSRRPELEDDTFVDVGQGSDPHDYPPDVDIG